MIIQVNKKEKEKIENLLKEKEMNICAAEDLFNYCFYSAQKRVGNHVDGIQEYLDLDLNDEENNYYFNSRIRPAFKLLNNNEYDADFYRQNIKPIPFKNKEYELTYLTFGTNHCFPYDDIEVKDDFVEVSRIGYFPKAFQYLAVMKKDVVWMSTDPNEINTMKQSMEEAKGHLVAFGLGLGYFPIMVANKDDVIDVTVVEKDQTIIDIFNTHILPLFSKRDKIKIIKDDAFNYCKKLNNNNCNYLFIDIWHNPEDGLPLYLRFKNQLKDKAFTISYWLEKSILAMYRRCLLTIVEESLQGFKDNDYRQAENEYDSIINALYFKTKHIVISKYDDLLKILQDNELQKLV